ncbi:hypothetical protein ACFS5L_24385 [Streptomyces phyllanthi]|uniref:Secreted protein n=1 Tax=Streptomyces phyllanthi TaxID=1803180 RepID=A0A5N8W521_9ACTN|nr:hypothetical protein [Streptomyces phyllanthi]MPY41986.1 hypothetical protein [Streptomyces phyllanthi]
MRLSRSFAPVTTAVALLIALPYQAMPYARVQTAKEHTRGAQPPAEPDPFGAECRTHVIGSRVVAYCHNPYADTDRVSLHIECDPWWDIDSDGAAVAAGPAQTVRLTGRCWQEVRSAWVSHQRQVPASSAPDGT